MSATPTWHVVCDVCGKRADVEPEHPNSPIMPEGWVSTMYDRGFPSGDFCSEACLRQAAVAEAIRRSADAFTPKEAEATT